MRVRDAACHRSERLWRSVCLGRRWWLGAACHRQYHGEVKTKHGCGKASRNGTVSSVFGLCDYILRARELVPCYLCSVQKLQSRALLIKVEWLPRENKKHHEVLLLPVIAQRDLKSLNTEVRTFNPVPECCQLVVLNSKTNLILFLPFWNVRYFGLFKIDYSNFDEVYKKRLIIFWISNKNN